MTTPDGKPSEARQRYLDAMHGLQSAIAWEMNQPGSTTASTKHMRVGVDSAHISDAGLARLLIEKGLFSLAEYEQAMADAAEAEVAARELDAARRLGARPGQIRFR
jgi:hypothetical protein